MGHQNHSQDQRTGYDTDVIVVGAGPIGLTLACALSHHGVDCRVFERKPGQSEDSKAHNLWARSQELLEGIGVREALAAQAYPVTSIKVFLDGKPLAEQDLSDVPSPYKAALYSGQDVIEATLAEAFERRGGHVERGRPVRDVIPDEHGVDVVVGHADEAEGSDGERLRCRYLVGADGVKGTVRKAVGLDFATTKLPGRATRQVDAKLSWRRSAVTDTLWFFLYEGGFAGVMPVWDGYHRLFFLEDEAEVPDRDPTLEEMVARAREVIGDETFVMTDPVWFSHGRFQHGVAPAYAQGRVFLAGDAGHGTLPIGGQGMNGGLHDAVGLAWRLAMTLAGQGGPDILGSYGAERQGAHAVLDAQQAQGFEQVMYRGRLADAALKLTADLIPQLGSRIFGSADLSQLSVAYPDSALSEDHFSTLNPLRRGAPRAGDRAPDARVTRADGEATTLFAQLRNPDGRSWGWCLLAFDGRDPGAHEALTRAVETAREWPWVHPLLVLAASRTGDGGVATAHLFDLDGAAHAAYGLEGTPALVLVRPDGHIAFRDTAGHPQRLQAYCQRIGAAVRTEADANKPSV